MRSKHAKKNVTPSRVDVLSLSGVVLCCVFVENEFKIDLMCFDEAHHIFNLVEGRDSESKNLKKWKEFLLSEDYKFKYTLGFTGTAYIQDDYFNDVIYRQHNGIAGLANDRRPRYGNHTGGTKTKHKHRNTVDLRDIALGGGQVQHNGLCEGAWRPGQQTSTSRHGGDNRAGT